MRGSNNTVLADVTEGLYARDVTLPLLGYRLND
jgi:hypothetical protein